MYQFPVSDRKRLHKGNTPTLPQTNYCQFCPAKFTRATHLQRHIRSHTNERSHRCDLCGAQFTRSDVLSRHKKTCRDPMVSSRSRQKSCQACAASKVKCDLEYPCSRCVSRHETCIFLNDPAISREKRRNAKERSMTSSPDCRQSSTESVYESSASSTPSPTSEDSSSPRFYSSPNTPDLGYSGCKEEVWTSLDGHGNSYPRWPPSTSSREYMDFSWLGVDNCSGDDDSYYSSIPPSVTVPHEMSTGTHSTLPYIDPTRFGMSIYDVSSTTSL
ncbi:uncharacterized protein EV420DRAFT_1083834 [Desarmillaria tabescens]|uniref:Zn(2)-C6 fungal-type domain-containing protein n=1 Tax=Armillaria tabescens TaxID=1929756 RepID=A0AA39JKA1_ARMTA|nr:uncharacterized protein EV420DRAFT_1083834 [Desarmillaria tabescens]KAK0442033.1 hypothetical protein EV420DRAFT_1083834 [Desarmillaria tabescens]